MIINMLKNLENVFEKIKLGIFAKEALFFILTQSVGLALILKINNSLSLQQALAPQQSFPANPWSFLINFLIVTVIFLLLLPLFKKRPIFLKVFFFFSIIMGLDIVFGIFLGEPTALVITICSAVILGLYPKILTHNLLFSIALAGIGAFIALNLEPFSIAIILSVLAIYDIIAVYVTKHMIKMAQVPASQGVFFGLILPKNNKDFLENKPSLTFDDKSAYYLLGGGDMVLPLILAASIARTNFYYGLIVAGFAFLGLISLHLIFASKTERKAMPGLPPLVFFSLLGYLIVALIGK